MEKIRTIIYEKPLERGDIILVKGTGLISSLIGSAFRMPSPLYWASGGRPSNHNAVYGFTETGVPCLFEAQPGGFVATPYSGYVARVVNRKCELIAARPVGGLTPRQRDDASIWLNEHLGTPYDYISYISHIWRLVLRLTPLVAVEDKSRFYCTESVQRLYSFLGRTELSKYHMIAPIHIEKAVSEGVLEVVARTIEIEVENN